MIPCFQENPLSFRLYETVPQTDTGGREENSVDQLIKFHVINSFSLYRENSVDKLIKALEDLWETFLNSISSSVSDYLSVEHLGLILNRLAEQEQFVVDRTFLPSFTPGEPNLIICPQSKLIYFIKKV